MLANVVEEAKSVVLHHDAVRGESFVDLVHPALHYLVATLAAQVLGGASGRGRR